MGKDLFAAYPDLTAQADAVLGYSIERLCMADPDGQLRNTQYTQPALYAVNALAYKARLERTGVKPDFVAGHSLGEYNALLAAGAFDFETGLRLVKTRGELMSRAGEGAMTAVVGLSAEDVEAVLNDHKIDALAIANYNAPAQTVVSGPAAAIEQARPIFEAAGGRLISLKVSAAFHSPLMQTAGQTFARTLTQVSFAELQIPVIANLDAAPYPQDRIAEILQAQLSQPVKWVQSIQYLLQQGETDFQEIGPGQVLTGLIKSIRGATLKTTCSATKSARPVAVSAGNGVRIVPEDLGSASFRQAYGIKYAYAAGAMYKGIASTGLVSRMAKAGLLAYFGTGGLRMAAIEDAIMQIRQALGERRNFGMNLLANYTAPWVEEETVDLFLKHAISHIEASAYIQLTPALVRYRLMGLRQQLDGSVSSANRVLAKVSRPEVAEAFLSPAPARIVESLLSAGKITAEQARLAQALPVADDLCVEADSGGHTDQGVMTVLLPSMQRLRDYCRRQFRYPHHVTVGAAGGIGTPEAAAAAFMLGADFVLTGSINQCTVEAGTSSQVKDLLQQMDVQDTAYAPAGDMFELGAKIQVLRKGVFFPARANKLHEVYRHYNGLDELPADISALLQEKYFRRSFREVYDETKAFYQQFDPQQISKAERDPKHKMALVFRWYFIHTLRLALQGVADRQVDYQVHSGPALGAFNRWVKGTALESWRNRHADELAEKLMQETALLLSQRMENWLRR